MSEPLQSLLGITGKAVVSDKDGRVAGRVSDALFGPRESRVVGLAVERPALLGVYDRRDRYLALDRAVFTDEGVRAGVERDAWDGPAAARLGVSWDETVIWRGMPVRTESGVSLGRVGDGRFDAHDGRLVDLTLTEGVTADVAVGVRRVSADLVRGFDGEAVVIADEAVAQQTSGGAAAAAGKSVAVAKHAVGDATERAAKAAGAAAAYGMHVAKHAASSDAGRRVGGWLKSLKDEFAEGMRGDGDE